MLEILQYDFMQKAILAGLMTAIVCPFVGIFVVMKRQSLIGDGLGHLAFAGITGGYLLQVYPLLVALLTTVCGALGIEFIRRKHSGFSDMALAIVFYLGMALAIVFSTMSRMQGTGLVSILFGSLMTVSDSDLWVMLFCSLFTIVSIFLFLEKLIFLVIDEEAAQVSGIAVNKLNLFFSVLIAIVITMGMLTVGILLVSAMMIVPVAIAHSLKISFKRTLFFSVLFSILSVISGIFISFYANIATGGTIVVMLITFYLFVNIYRWLKMKTVNQ